MFYCEVYIFRLLTAGLKRRYWNDELEPCLIKYCLKYQYDRTMYIKCVQRYCSAGLVTIPRDLDELEPEDQSSEISHLLPSVDDAFKVCDALYCQSMTSHLEHLICMSVHCEQIMSYISGDNDRADPISRFAAMHHMYPTGLSRDRMRLLQFSLLNLCGQASCSGSGGADYLQCMARNCYSQRREKKSIQEKKHYVDLEEQTAQSEVGKLMHEMHQLGSNKINIQPDPSSENSHSKWKRNQAKQSLNKNKSQPSLGKYQLDASLDENQLESSLEKDQSEPGLMRKRRVNAISAQCIMSQCGQKGGVARKMCIIRLCHG